MATTIKPLINTNNIIKQTNPIKSDIARVNLTATAIKSSLFKKNKITRESISKVRFFQSKRDQQVRRKEREDILESSGISGTTRRMKTIAEQSTRGFLGRILDFIGTLLVGWLVNNLPSIFTMASELIARIKRMFSLLTEFSQNLVNSFFNFGQLLGAVYKNISSFDFFDTSGRVERSLEDLQNNFSLMEQQFSEGFNLFTTSLGKGLIGGEDAAPFGTDYTETPGTSGVGTAEQQAMLKTIRYAEGTTSSYGTISGGDIVPELADGKLTVKEVIDLGNTSRLPSRYGGRKVNHKWSGATGAYQFMPDTLQGLVTNGVIGANELFTPQKQDELAIYLAKRRGVTDALLKKEGMSQKVSDLLAPEWASFPYSPKGGKSYYGQSYKPIGELQKIYNSSVKTLKNPSPVPSPNISTTVIDEINVSGPSGGTPTVGLSGGRGEFGAPRQGRIHEGIDIGTSGQKGYYVSFKKSGRVDFAKVAGAYGNTVDIITSDGTCYRFAHLAKIMVRRGESYNGQTIGEIGNTGSSPDIHLHYEVRPGGPYGKAIDPRPYLNLLSIGRKLAGQPGKPTQAVQAAQTTPVNTKLSSINQNLISSPQETPKLTSNVAYSPNENKLSRSGQKIIIIDDVQESSPQIISSGGSQSPPIIISQDSLNSFIKQKLFLDLAYT
jgi:murein DD-endopeptidase MepM/ murein hydrolase activator NlpD